MATNKDFADYCCELMSSCGPCVSKRMFGGFGISTDGLTIGIIADLGSGEKLWLKADDSTRGQYEAAGCARFTYDTKHGAKSANYYSAPEEAMDSAEAMRPWAALAMACAVRAQAAKRGTAAKPSGKTSAKTAKKAAVLDSSPAAPSKSGPAKSSHLSQTVLERAREVAKKVAASKSMPTPKAPSPSSKRAAAPAPKAKAARKSAKGASTAVQ
jgi:DNA transformation protein and related proteins